MIAPELAAAEYAVFLFSTVCHEASHAYSAHLLGDDTAARGGQVSLSPWPHLRREPIGMVLFPLMGLLSGGYILGWASTPYNRDWAQSYPRRAALMALAGPAANAVLLLLAALALRIGYSAGFLSAPDDVSFAQVAQGHGGPGMDAIAMLLSAFFSLNLMLLLFNLLPLGPMDGTAVLGLVPGLERLRDAMRGPQFRFVGMLGAMYLFPYIYQPIELVALNLLYPGAHYQ